MLIVNTYLKQGDKGLGLYSRQKIQFDQKIIQTESALDRWYYPQQINGMADFFCKYAIYSEEKGAWYLFGDNARFIRHSRNPNICKAGFHYYACAAVHPGDELLADYTQLCDWVRVHGLKFRQS